MFNFFGKNYLQKNYQINTLKGRFVIVEEAPFRAYSKLRAKRYKEYLLSNVEKGLVPALPNFVVSLRDDLERIKGNAKALPNTTQNKKNAHLRGKKKASNVDQELIEKEQKGLLLDENEKLNEGLSRSAMTVKFIDGHHRWEGYLMAVDEIEKKYKKISSVYHKQDAQYKVTKEVEEEYNRINNMRTILLNSSLSTQIFINLTPKEEGQMFYDINFNQTRVTAGQGVLHDHRNAVNVYARTMLNIHDLNLFNYVCLDDKARMVVENDNGYLMYINTFRHMIALLLSNNVSKENQIAFFDAFIGCGKRQLEKAEKSKKINSFFFLKPMQLALVDFFTEISEKAEKGYYDRFLKLLEIVDFSRNNTMYQYIGKGEIIKQGKVVFPSEAKMRDGCLQVIKAYWYSLL